MVPLIDIEPGSVVAGRYVVSSVDHPWLGQTPEIGVVCTALDAILDEPVLIHVADAEASGDVLDAARRVSILGDPRIAPTIDVGRSNGLDYVVARRVATTALSDIVAGAPLPIDAARALVGEIGTVLVTAARRGIFHMFLRPSSIGITKQGTVLISGIGIDAAIGQSSGALAREDCTPTRASRKDALDLVRILYAASTGHWPGDDAVDRIPASGRDNSRIKRAKSLNPAIPHDFDDFVSGVLTGSDPGPGSAAEVLGYLDEWDPLALRTVKRAPTTENDHLFEASPRSFDEATTLPSPRATNFVDPNSTTTASEDQVQAALIRIGVTRPGTRGLAAGVSGKTTGRYAERMQMRAASSFPIGASQLDEAAKDWNEWSPEETYSAYSGYADHEHDANLTTPILNRDDPDPTTQAIEIVEDDSEDDNDTRVILDDDDDGSWFLGGMFETHEQQREHQLREYERERRLSRAQEEDARRRLAALEAASAARRAEARAATPAKEVRRLSPETPTASSRTTAPRPATSPEAPRGGSRPSASTVRGAAPGAGLAAPAATGAAAGANAAVSTAPGGARDASGGGGSSDQGRPAGGSSGSKKPILWIVLSAIVVIALIVGISFLVGGKKDEPTPVATSSAPASKPPSEKPTTKAAAKSITIDSVDAIDPEGDGTENNDLAALVIPGKKGSWRTDRYNSASFGNLKSGVGLVLTLKETSTVTSVKVKSPVSGGTFEILDGTDPKDAKKVGEGSFDSEGTTVTLDKGVKTDSLILWITELPDADGGFRATVSSIDLR